MNPLAARATAAQVLIAAGFGLAIAACQQGASADDGGPWEARVVARYPHDPAAFTQGLIFHDGYLYESTGRNGESSLRKVDLETGSVERLRAVDSAYFAEGLTIFEDRLIQLTWRSQTGFVYRLSDFGVVERFSYGGQGWGLTHDGEKLILSDGTSTLRFLDPDGFGVIGWVTVKDGETTIENLNELEYIDGEIWANVWYDDRIVRIDPNDGRVIGWVDLSELYPADERGSEAVLNGIAYDRDSGRIFVTGKLWPMLFEIEAGPARR